MIVFFSVGIKEILTNLPTTSTSTWTSTTTTPTPTTTPTTTTTTTVTTTTTTRITCIPMPPPSLSLAPSQNKSFISHHLLQTRGNKSVDYPCPSHSPYVPMFLSKNSLTSFGYPIYQTIVCYSSNSAFFINCPRNKFIHIYSAYYGIQDATSSDICGTTTGLQTAPSPSSSSSSASSSSASSSVLCYNQNTFDLINASCEYKQNCTLIVSTNYFGDPCLGFRNKQMFIQYQCLDTHDVDTYRAIKECPLNGNMSRICPVVNDTSVNEIFECTDFLSISCPANTYIQIVCSFYGIDPVLRCAGGYYTGAPTACYLKSSSETIFSLCNGKQRCSLDASTDFSAADPCVSYAKMIYVQYRCVDSAEKATGQLLLQQLESAAGSTTKSSSLDYDDPFDLSKLPYCPRYVELKGECPESSHYEPKLLDDDTLISFGFPVNQQIVCDRSQLIINCPIGQLIHVHAAYYGIQSHTATACNNYTSMTESGFNQLPDMCFFSNTFNLVNKTCHMRQACSLFARAGTFGGNPCNPNIQKQLFVQYQCVDDYIMENKNSIAECKMRQTTTTTPSEAANRELTCMSEKKIEQQQQQAIWCKDELRSINLTCSSKKLKIQCAFFGYHPSLNGLVCQHLNAADDFTTKSSSSTATTSTPWTTTRGNDTLSIITQAILPSTTPPIKPISSTLHNNANCYFKESLMDYLSSNCLNRHTCILDDFNDLFYNPCPMNINATLIINYTCN